MYFKRHMNLGRRMSRSDFKGLEQEDFQTVLRADGETETTQENIQDCLELDEGDPALQLLTEDVIKDSAVEEESDNELDELQESYN
jgi:hypothetical protein